jgi:hypothetical protein
MHLIDRSVQIELAPNSPGASRERAKPASSQSLSPSNRAEIQTTRHSSGCVQVASYPTLSALPGFSSTQLPITQRRSGSRLAQPALDVFWIEAYVVAESVVGDPSGAGLRQQPGVRDAETLSGGLGVDQPERARLTVDAARAARAVGEPGMGAAGITRWDRR